MIIEGQLIISSGISRLDGTRLMRGALDNGGFGRATSFLRQERNLESGETIRVDGVAAEFQGSDVIVISDAARAGQSLTTAASVAAAVAKTAGSKTSAAKKSAKKKRTRKSASKK
ncbi:MAG TPA: hypothetical protein VJP89_11255 [Pyrinomonadaceae bacterium]|nr:hypothetical protein [Pyrinomonadaceae bacterium]